MAAFELKYPGTETFRHIYYEDNVLGINELRGSIPLNKLRVLGIESGVLKITFCESDCIKIYPLIDLIINNEFIPSGHFFTLKKGQTCIILLNTRCFTAENKDY